MRQLLCAATLLIASAGWRSAAARQPDYAVGPQYDTTHVYVAPAMYGAFMKSFVATFGGTLGPELQLQVTPTPSRTKSQLAFTPAGTVSAFGFLTPIPRPFGVERNGYLVSDPDAATAAAIRNGATRLITTFPDKFGRDVVIQWPGGVSMQLYSHTAKPRYAPLKTVPDNRIYLTPDAADAFIRSWSGFAHARVLRDNPHADAAEIGQASGVYRHLQLTTGYGGVDLAVSNGQLPWPYGVETTGFGVGDLDATPARARAAGAIVAVAPHDVGSRRSAMVSFPGGYVAEIHAPAKR